MRNARLRTVALLVAAFVALPAIVFAASSFSQNNLIQIQSPSSIVPTYPGYGFGGNGTVSAFSASITYLPRSIAVGSDGNIYQAAATTTGTNPTTDTGSHWYPIVITNSITLNIPSRFANFAAAWNFLASTTISNSATTTIQFADGLYSLPKDTAYTINHPSGDRIAIMGDIANPNAVEIYAPGPTVAYGPGSGPFPSTGSLFNLTNGHKIGLIDGFFLLGPGIATSTIYGFNGIQAWDGSVANLGTHMVIRNFYAGLFSNEGSTILAASTTVSGGGDGNVWAYGNSFIDCVGCDSRGAGTYYSGSGYLSDNNSYINLSNAKAGANVNGLSLYEDSSAQVGGATFGGAGAGGNNTSNSIKLNYSAIGNIEGFATYNDGNKLSFSPANYIQGCSQNADSNTQEILCANTNYTQAIWNNNNNGALISINQTGHDAFGGSGNTTMGFNVWGGTGVPLRLGTNATLAAYIDTLQRWGIGTTTPLANFQVTASSTNATTSIQFGKSGQNKGTCITYYDSAGSPVYMFFAAGATSPTYQNGGTTPSGCTN